MFCGDHADSDEDAWPLWLLRELGQGKKVRIGFERADGAVKTWGGVEAGVKVKHVCADCNNGWMSDLEGMAQPRGHFDLVLCRNLTFTYFDAPLQNLVMAGIAQRIRADGFLVLGRHESLPAGAPFLPLAPALGIYRKARIAMI